MTPNELFGQKLHLMETFWSGVIKHKQRAASTSFWPLVILKMISGSSNLKVTTNLQHSLLTKVCVKNKARHHV